MLKRVKDDIIGTIKEEYKFILFMLLLLIILNFPLNYYITIGGGVSDASSRIEVTNGYKHKGSFNISYVKQLDANILFYGLSYLVPTWEREDANLYKYNSTESLEDIAFRSDLDLKAANGMATYWAYTLAGKKVEETSSKLYVISTSEKVDVAVKTKDEILSVDHHTFQTADEYSDYLQTKEVGEMIEVEVIRNNKEETVLTELHQIDGENKIGIYIQKVNEYQTDPELNIKFRRSESGPSGGLITTLEIYNQLVKKDITHGKVIAGTGTIEEDGSIGTIGGIEHKVLGAASAKADIFLCPGGRNYTDAENYIKEKKLKIKLIKVETIQEAITKLEELA